MAGVAALCAIVAVGAATAAVQRDPQVALTGRDQAKVRTFVLRRGDLGASWTISQLQLGTQPLAASSTCAGFDPDLSALTIRGQAGSHAESLSGAVTLEAFLLDTPAQARTIYRAMAAPFIRRCFRLGSTRGGAHIEAVDRDPSAGSGVVGYTLRLTSTNPPAHVYGHYVFMQAGRVWVTLVFAGTDKKVPVAVETRTIGLIRKRIGG